MLSCDERDRSIPVIGVDFCFFKSEADGGEDPGVTIVAVDCDTGMIRSTAVPDKSVSKYATDFW